MLCYTRVTHTHTNKTVWFQRKRIMHVMDVWTLNHDVPIKQFL